MVSSRQGIRLRYVMKRELLWDPYAGDTVDWWRVESIEPRRAVRFFAEMKVPGRAFARGSRESA